MKYNPELLLEFYRNGLTERFHTGFVIKYNNDGTYTETGISNDYPFYLRSCAKPLQASLLIDYGADLYYDLSASEIAICCASHAGEKCHLDVLRSLMNKAGLTESMFKCGVHAPLSETMKVSMLQNNDKPTVLHNNCSGKHAMMLALCMMKGWDSTNYDDAEHVLQKCIKEQIYNLCELTQEYPMTKDGCGVPIYSMPLKNMLKGYINLFCDEKYKKIKEAFINYPYIIGGENRLDTAIISNGKNLIAKVGAGGLCIVVNTELKEGFIVKISDCDMQARAIVTISLLHKLNWLKSCDTALLEQDNREILTHHNEKVGEAKTTDWIEFYGNN